MKLEPYSSELAVHDEPGLHYRDPAIYNIFSDINISSRRYAPL